MYDKYGQIDWPKWNFFQTDRQTYGLRRHIKKPITPLWSGRTDRQTVTHKSPPCNLHRWALKQPLGFMSLTSDHFGFLRTSGTHGQISKCINLSQGKYYWRLNYHTAHPSRSKAIECQPQEEIREAHTENPITSWSNPQFFWHQDNWLFLKINYSFSSKNPLSFIPRRNYKCH